MKNLIQEELERYRRLSGYNPKLTLTENAKINEQALGTTVRDVEFSMGKTLNTIIKDYKIGTLGTTEITRLLALEPKAFERSLNKAIAEDVKNGIVGTLGPAGKDLSKIDLFRQIASDSKSAGGRALTPDEVDNLITIISRDNKLKAKNFKSKTAGVKGKKLSLIHISEPTRPY